MKITLFRVLQEALTNIAKHSQAKLVEISLGKKNGVMEMVIKDHGVGFDIDAAVDVGNGKRGLGLTSMRERREISGGSFSIRTLMGEGTTIRASWPRTQREGS